MKWINVKDAIPVANRKIWMSNLSTNGDWCAHAVYQSGSMLPDEFESFCASHKITRWAYDEDYDIDSECSEECY